MKEASLNSPVSARWCKAALAAIAGLAMSVAQAQSPQPSEGKASSSKAGSVASPKSAKKPSAPAKLVIEPKAMELLKATSARLAAAKTMSFTAIASYEYPSQMGPAIVYTSRYDVTMQRPNGLRVLMPGDGPASEFYFDGKIMMAFSPAENLVAVADAPPTVDGALKAAFQASGLYFPFTDLLLAAPYEALTAGTIHAFVIGPSSIVGGVRTDMVAWANKDVFLQIWIGADDKLPRRVRAVYAADIQRLRHEVTFSDWKLDAPVAPGTFTSAKASAATRMAFAHPLAKAPPGAKPIARSKPAPANTKPQ